MKINLLFIVLPLMILLQACSNDVDTPPSKKRSTYLDQPLRAANSEQITCDGETYVLPRSSAHESLDQYILQLQSANTGLALSRLSISDQQQTYRNCLRPKILERFE